MKTSYVYKADRGDKPKRAVTVGEDAIKAMEDTFLYLSEERERVAEMAKVESSMTIQSSKNEKSSKKKQKKSSEGEPKKKKKGWVIALVSVVVVGVVAVGVLSWLYVGKKNLNTEVESFRTSLSYLYSNEERTDLLSMSEEDFDYLYSLASEYESKGIDISDVRSEIVSMDVYTECKNKLISIMQSDVDIFSSDYQETLEDVLTDINSGAISVSSLRISLSAMYEEARQDYENYVFAKDQLEGMLSGEIEYYELDFKYSVAHEANLQELTSVKEAVLATKELKAAENELELVKQEYAEVIEERGLLSDDEELDWSNLPIIEEDELLVNLSLKLQDAIEKYNSCMQSFNEAMLKVDASYKNQ